MPATESTLPEDCNSSSSSSFNSSENRELSIHDIASMFAALARSHSTPDGFKSLESSSSSDAQKAYGSFIGTNLEHSESVEIHNQLDKEKVISEPAVKEQDIIISKHQLQMEMEEKRKQLEIAAIKLQHEKEMLDLRYKLEWEREKKEKEKEVAEIKALHEKEIMKYKLEFEKKQQEKEMAEMKYQLEKEKNELLMKLLTQQSQAGGRREEGVTSRWRVKHT